TEYEEHTVPLRKERVRVEREPVPEEARAEAPLTPEVSEEEQEIVLHEERPVVSRENVPVERVRVEKESFVEDETVGGEVRREHVESETEFTARTDEQWRGGTRAVSCGGPARGSRDVAHGPGAPIGRSVRLVRATTGRLVRATTGRLAEDARVTGYGVRPGRGGRPGPARPTP